MSANVIMSLYGKSYESWAKNSTDEIDLLDLLLQLWNGKKTIITTVCIAIVLAIGYLAVAKEKWTSTAIITPPQLGQLADYPTAVAVIDPSNSKDISNDVLLTSCHVFLLKP